MSIGDALDALRRLVAEAARGREVDLQSALDRSEFGLSDLTTVPGEGSIDHVRVELASTVRLVDLEERFGPSRTLPQQPSGASTRTVLFDSTLPGDGESGATVLAEVDAAGQTSTIIVRADTF